MKSEAETRAYELVRPVCNHQSVSPLRGVPEYRVELDI
jgi:hypothetical protein